MDIVFKKTGYSIIWLFYCTSANGTPYSHCDDLDEKNIRFKFPRLNRGFFKGQVGVVLAFHGKNQGSIPGKYKLFHVGIRNMSKDMGDKMPKKIETLLLSDFQALKIG